MSVWLIEPRDPIIFRDGRPFSATPGARATSLPFPYPSTLAGAVRTRAGQDENGHFTAEVSKVLKIGIHGPALTEVNQNGLEYYFPAPADCLVIQPEGEKDDKIGQRLWAHPVDVKVGELTNLEGNLKLVSVSPAGKGKTHTKAPQFWKWDEHKKWLIAPADDHIPIALEHLGTSGPMMESRVHVSISPKTGTALKGALFQTIGLEFAYVEDKRKLSAARQYALAVETSASLSEGVGFLGGERRTVNWRKCGDLPKCPEEIGQDILEHKHCRLLLATPAIFTGGYLPSWIKQLIPGLMVTVVAAAAPRYQAVSGWDYATGEQKASRRLAPARSVYFLKLDGDEEAIEKFVDAVWMQNVSDAEQDRRDGFGLALLGTWDGDLPTLEVK